MKSVELHCPAKVNLYLRIVRRRKDGYHELVTLMQPVELFDELVLTLEGEGIRLQCQGMDLPQGEENIAWKAARLFQRKTGEPRGVEIRLYKRIPVGAGLGGGSSDAAGVLKGLNALLGNPVPEDTLHKWALSLGADVPFFISARPAVATGIGEILHRIEIHPELYYVVAFPGWSVSTRWVYGNLDLGLTNRSKQFRIPYLIKKAEDIIGLLHNDLETVTARRFPWVSGTKSRLIDHGALGALMSGSGPTVFGVFADEGTAREVSRRLLQEVGGDVWWVRGIH